MVTPFKIDHDYHIHSYISPCAGDLRHAQTGERILQYAREQGLSRIVVTDHFWDKDVPGEVDWYQTLGLHYDRLTDILPLPQDEGIRFFFGCEVEMDSKMRIGIAPDKLDRFDFIIVATDHLHLEGITVQTDDLSNQQRAELYVQRFQALLDADLPFEKVGIAHPTCSLIAGYGAYENHLDILDLISDETFENLFCQTARRGMGVELNFPLGLYRQENYDRALRPYRIAKNCGCKFYLGTDAHHPKQFDGAAENFDRIISLLQLQESDKFHFPAEQAKTWKGVAK